MGLDAVVYKHRSKLPEIRNAPVSIWRSIRASGTRIRAYFPSRLNGPASKHCTNALKMRP